MPNQLTLTFAGDEKGLSQASKNAAQDVEKFGASVSKSGDDMASASQQSNDYLSKVGKLGAGIDGLSTAFDDVGGTLQSFVDLQNQGFERSQRLKRALVDVQQAQEDYNQALRDGNQAAIDSDQAAVDLEQAWLDQTTALKDYNEAVKEHGKNSDEAQQAQIDMKQAGIDVQQAQEDAAQATRDASQAAIDAQGATLDLVEAQKEAHPPDIAKWAEQIQAFTPILSGLVGIVGLVTAAQWAWNAAQLASPLTWIILAVVALVAVIVLVATKTTFFQDLWKSAWGGIKDAAQAVGSWFKDTLWGKWIKGTWDLILNKAVSFWNWMKDLPGRLKSAFSGIANFLFQPFRTAFNRIADGWNSTVGRLSWTIPGWVPGVGGNSISAPHLPKFHSGGVVPGAPGTEMVALLQAGETVTAAGQGGSGDQMVHVVVNIDRDTLLDIIAKGQRRGGPKFA